MEHRKENAVGSKFCCKVIWIIQHKYLDGIRELVSHPYPFFTLDTRSTGVSFVRQHTSHEIFSKNEAITRFSITMVLVRRRHQDCHERYR